MKPIEIKFTKNTSLILATFAPMLFGCLFYLVVKISESVFPLMATIWYTVGAFGIVLYWRYVGTMYRESNLSFAISFGVAHLYAIVFFIIYLIVYRGETVGTNFADQIVFWFIYPVEFISVSIASLFHGAVSDAMLVFYAQLYGLIIMALAFALGFWQKDMSIKKENRNAKKKEAIGLKIQEATKFKTKE
ncbi:MAG: hypothetical protein IJW18_09430 [Lachnospiraceae bacterium]|nr:hypothetical protein [Lachnospiraceae bacterium]